MKSKLAVEDLKTLKFAEYRRLAANELKRMQNTTSPGEKLHFIVFSKYKYADAKDKALPFLVVGNLKGPWEQYFKDTGRKRPEKDFSFGFCHLGPNNSLIMEPKVGKFNKKAADLIQKVFLNPLGLTVGLEGVEEDEDEDEDGAAPAVAAAAAPAAPAAKEAVSKAEQGDKGDKRKAAEAEKQSQMKDEAKKLNATLAAYRKLYAGVNAKLLPRLKKGEGATQVDLVQLGQLTKAYDAFMKEYKGMSKGVQKTFTPSKTLLSKQAADIAKLAKAAKAKKVSLAEQLTNDFFKQQGQERKAKPNEIALMQASLKTAMAEANAAEGEEKQRKLKAVFLAAKLRGPKFSTGDVSKVAERLAAS